MASQQDATLLVQLAQWGTALGLEGATLAVFADDFDPESASAEDPQVACLLNWAETVGTLTKHGLLDTDLVHDWFWVAGLWERVGPAARKLREKLGSQELYVNFETLASGQTG